MQTREAVSIKEFIKTHYRHFNAAQLVDAAQGWVDLTRGNGKMFLSLAGAMSTSEIGISLAELIRCDKIAGISTTGANLEEDLFNLVAHSHYRRLKDYRNLSAEDETRIAQEGYNRITDTCIPEEEAMKRLTERLFPLWEEADRKGESFFPHEYFYRLIREGQLQDIYDIDPKDSWMVAACEKNIPIFTPGWEDSTCGNGFVAEKIKGRFKSFSPIRSGLEAMESFVHWFSDQSRHSSVGFFQIGGGIAGDFPICVVPLIRQDMGKECPYWAYFCQISDSTTSYGSYSGAVPNEKITWGKLSPDTPRFIIESDATIVAPLIFQYVLESDIK